MNLHHQASVLQVGCVDKQCKAVMYVRTQENPIECMKCGQRHDLSKFTDVSPVYNNEARKYIAQSCVFREYLIQCQSKSGTELVKVLGLSNFYCKLLSPFLTVYGMDKDTGRAVLLRDMKNGGEIFDCSSFSNRAFLIDPGHLDIPGFGRDITGSMDYLKETLTQIVASNGDQERLVPVHSDGDGHCLVHAVSRALVGRELFWHPLRCRLKLFFQDNLGKCKELFKEFIDVEEWPSIIDECDPDFKPPGNEPVGLRNIHIFGLANVLKRPIILLDSWDNMNKSGDYSAVFLPGFEDPEDCKDKDGFFNKPICIAWSSRSHNHFIPLVGILTRPLPVLPRSMLPKVWAMSQSKVTSYIDFDENDTCTIGGNRVLSENYIQRLAYAMERVFLKRHKIHPALVEYAKQFYLSAFSNDASVTEAIISRAKASVAEGRIMHCGTCNAIIEIYWSPVFFYSTGPVYQHVLESHKRLTTNIFYPVNMPEINFNGSCKYDSLDDRLHYDPKRSKYVKCIYCHSTDLEKLKGDGCPRNNTEQELNMRNMLSSSNALSSSASRETDNTPDMLVVRIDWKNKVKESKIPDFQLVDQSFLGEHVYHISDQIIKQHYPEEMESYSCRAYIAELILRKLGRSIFDSNSDQSIPSTSSTNAYPPASQTSQECISSVYSTATNKRNGSGDAEQVEGMETDDSTTTGSCTKVKPRTFQYVPPAQGSAESGDLRAAGSSKVRDISTVQSQLFKVTSPGSSEIDESATAGSFNNAESSSVELQFLRAASSQGSSDADQSPYAVSPKKSDLSILAVESPSITVKIISPQGASSNLTLEESGITYAALQQWIKDVFSVPIQNQRIKIGFPPKELEVPSSGIVPLKHGDRLMVENCPSLNSNRPAPMRTMARDFSSSDLTPAQRAQFDALFNRAKNSPELFKIGGKIYDDITGSRILVDLQHINLKEFPTKLFSFHQEGKYLELCVKPWGHFQIGPDTDSKIEQVKEGKHDLKGYRSCPVMHLVPGYKAQVANKAPKRPLPPSTLSELPESTVKPSNLCRKAPGFSVLSSPQSDDMDVS